MHKKYTFELNVISPVHIGNGQTITNWSYGIDKGTVNVYSLEKVVKEVKDPKKLSTLSSYIEEYVEKKTLEEVLKQWGIKVEPDYKVALKGSLKKADKYQHINEHIKTFEGIYIPGSEVKGAIRNAVLYHILKNKALKDKSFANHLLDKYRNCLRNENNKKVKGCLKKFSTELENEIFRGKNQDAKKDIFRLLSVSDSNTLPVESIIEIVETKTIGARKIITSFFETVKRGAKFRLTISIDVSLKNNFKSELKEFLTIENIAKACREKAIDTIQEEIEFFKNFSNNSQLSEQEKSQIIKKLEQRLTLFKQVPPNWLILRIGKNQGFHSITINTLIKHLDYKLFSSFYHRVVPKGYPQLPNKTREIAVKDLDIFGWCILNPV